MSLSAGLMNESTVEVAPPPPPIVMSSPKVNLLDFDGPGLSEWFVSKGEPAYRAQQVTQWLHQRRVADVAQMTNLSKSLREWLLTDTEVVLPTVLSKQMATDGCVKWLFRLADGNAIETVFIPEVGRGTLCISSQAGCGLNCSFCATGKEGFNRNLTTAEIIGQLWWALHELAPAGLDTEHVITNVVMMGMGEPLLNYGPVLKALKLMTSDHAYGLSKYRVTVSTAGLVPMMQQLQQDSSVSLAVSLHAPNNALRDQLVPLNRKYPLEILLPVCRDYFPTGSKRVVTFEYVMLAGVNDQLSHARELAQLLRNIPCKVNLIPFNPFSGSRYQSTPWPQILRFQDTLTAQGLATWVRKTRGQEIDAACGQLAGQIQDRTGRHQRWLKTGSLTPISNRQVGSE